MLFAERPIGDILAAVPRRDWSFTVPKLLRPIFKFHCRELGLLSKSAYASIRRTFQALAASSDVRPDCVVSLHNFGAYGANFNAHAHALVSDGVFTREGEFLPIPLPAFPLNPRTEMLIGLRKCRKERRSLSRELEQRRGGAASRCV